MRVYHDTYWQAIADEWWGYYRDGVQVWAPYCFRDSTGWPLYIGHSNAPHLRHDQHIHQPWWPDYLDGGTWEVRPQRFDNEDDSARFETHLIHTELPLHNVRDNLDNPYRIIPAPRAPLAARYRLAPVRARGGMSGPLAVAAAVIVAGLCWSAAAPLSGGTLFWLALAAIPAWLIIRRRF